MVSPRNLVEIPGDRCDYVLSRRWFRNKLRRPCCLGHYSPETRGHSWSRKTGEASNEAGAEEGVCRRKSTTAHFLVRWRLCEYSVQDGTGLDCVMQIDTVEQTITIKCEVRWIRAVPIGQAAV